MLNIVPCHGGPKLNFLKKKTLALIISIKGYYIVQNILFSFQVGLEREILTIDHLKKPDS